LSKKTLVIGLGNPILGDDGIGWEVVRVLRESQVQEDVELDCLALGGISLMERLVGYQQAIIIDAMNSGHFPVGSVQSFGLDVLPKLLTGHLASAHDATLQEALQMGRDLGAELPEEVVIVAIETPDVYDFSEELSETAKQAVPLAVEEAKKIMGEL
jgi:hydrogenase maturation protease